MSGAYIVLELFEMIGDGITLSTKEAYTVYRDRFSKVRAFHCTRDAYEADYQDEGDVILGEVWINRVVYLPFSAAEKENCRRAISEMERLMNQPLTSYRKGFPQVSGKVISGYAVDDNCQFGTLAGLFNATSQPRWDSTARTNTYSDVTRLSPDLACFAWGTDYIFFWEKLVYAGDKLVSAEWNFSDFETSTYLIVGRYVDGQMVIDTQADDPRVPVLLAWFTATLERKASGEQRAVHVRDLFPTDAQWYREVSQ